MGVPEPLWFTVHLPERDDLNHWRERALAAEAQVRALREAQGELLDLAYDDSFVRLVLTARTILERHYPADIFTGASGDPGPRLVAALRECLDAQDEALRRRGALG